MPLKKTLFLWSVRLFTISILPIFSPDLSLSPSFPLPLVLVYCPFFLKFCPVDLSLRVTLFFCPLTCWTEQCEQFEEKLTSRPDFTHKVVTSPLPLPPDFVITSVTPDSSRGRSFYWSEHYSLSICLSVSLFPSLRASVRAGTRVRMCVSQSVSVEIRC